MTFKCFSAQGLFSGLAFVQDLKLGHYMKIPPRSTWIGAFARFRLLSQVA